MHPDIEQDRTEGVPPDALHNDVLLRELAQLHRTRHETFLYGSDDAVQRHTLRMGQLEAEFVRRFPDRHVAAGRTRSGARAREIAARVQSVPE